MRLRRVVCRVCRSDIWEHLQEQTDDRETPATTASAPQTGEDDGEQVKRVFFNLADAPAEPDHLSPAKSAALPHRLTTLVGWLIDFPWLWLVGQR